MSIRVTCPGCHTRFNVSDKFAGREGPCPKCKKPIKIPDKTEEVVIHAPETGPKDSQGRPVLKPIARKETKLSSAQIAIIACTIIGFLMAALLLNQVYEPGDFPGWLLWLGAFGLGVAVSYAGYTFLRDQELGVFVTKELWIRVVACGAIYALLWFLIPVMNYGFVDLGKTGAFVAIGIMLAAGAAVGMLAFDFDYLVGLLHCGMYMACCLLCRFIAGLDTIPAPTEPTRPSVEPVTSMADAVYFLSQALGW
jgi:hypothetical protein